MNIGPAYCDSFLMNIGQAYRCSGTGVAPVLGPAAVSGIADENESNRLDHKAPDRAENGFPSGSCEKCGLPHGQCECAGPVSTTPQATESPTESGKQHTTGETPETPVKTTAQTAVETEAHASRASKENKSSGATSSSKGVNNLSTEELAQVRELQQRDREVRSHEQTHIAAAGGHAGGARYSYQTGPDGRQYAVGGEVSIDTSKVPGNPEATIQKAQTVRRAALAPASPSGTDRAVAAAASQMEAQARTEKSKEKEEEDGPALVKGKALDDSETTPAEEIKQQSDAASEFGAGIIHQDQTSPLHAGDEQEQHDDSLFGSRQANHNSPLAVYERAEQGMYLSGRGNMPSQFNGNV